MNEQIESVESIEKRLYKTTTGHTDAIEIEPGGKTNGLDYGPRVVDLLVLDHDGVTVAYRYSDDSIDEDWHIGTIEDARDCAVQYVDTYEQDEL
jgi:hypothetical protein